MFYVFSIFFFGARGFISMIAEVDLSCGISFQPKSITIPRPFLSCPTGREWEKPIPFSAFLAPFEH